MLELKLSLNNLNASLQVGDGVYARRVDYQLTEGLPQATEAPIPPSLQQSTGVNHYVGILMEIDYLGNNEYALYVDETANTTPTYIPLPNDFLMFSKFSQGDSGVLGYYAEAKFINDSREKAELFAVSSEIIINSN